MDASLLDPHGGDLGGFFMVHGSREQCSALTDDEEFRRACIDAGLIVDNFGVVPAVTGEGVGREMAMYTDAVGKVGIGGHALAGAHRRLTATLRRRPWRPGARRSTVQQGLTLSMLSFHLRPTRLSLGPDDGTTCPCRCLQAYSVATAPPLWWLTQDEASLSHVSRRPNLSMNRVGGQAMDPARGHVEASLAEVHVLVEAELVEIAPVDGTLAALAEPRSGSVMVTPGSSWI